MKEWLLSVGIVILIISLLKIVLPNGKTKKTVMFVFGVLSILTFIKPIVNIKDGNLDLGTVFESKIDYQNDYIYFVYEKNAEIKKKEFSEKLNDLGVKNAKIDAIFSIDTKYAIKYEKVIVNLKESVILSENKHIDIIEQIKKTASEIFRIEYKEVIIYE